MIQTIKVSDIELLWGRNKGSLKRVDLEDQGFEKPSVILEFTGDDNPKNKVSLISYLTQPGFLAPFKIDSEIKDITFTEGDTEVTVETLDAE